MNVLSATALGAWFLLPTVASAQTPEPWHFQASIYAYLPTIGGSSTFPTGSGGSDVGIDAQMIVDNLKFVFMGSFEARKGRWGGFTDVIYLDVGNTTTQTRGITVGNVAIPAGGTANAELDLSGTAWTLGGYYRAVAGPTGNLDVVAGTRLLDLSEIFDWQFGGNIGSIPLRDRTGHSQLSHHSWDAIIGVKGRAILGDGRKWFLPYYADLGTGESKQTWQAMGGVGYSYRSMDFVVAYRYLDYTMKTDEPIQTLNLKGPLVAATFRW